LKTVHKIYLRYTDYIKKLILKLLEISLYYIYQYLFEYFFQLNNINMKYTTNGHTRRVSLRLLRDFNPKNEIGKLRNILIDHMLKLVELRDLPFGDEKQKIHANIEIILDDMGKLIRKMYPPRRSTRIRIIQTLQQYQKII
jgi:hypothetical protein